MTTNLLRYSIRDEFLYGTVNGATMQMRAFSGGGRGSTAGAARMDLKHWSTTKKAPAKFNHRERGGPLPNGFYLASHYGVHPHLGPCAVLTQTVSSLLQRDYRSPTGVTVTDRGGFFIHGPGPKGSDGCIVPASIEDLKALLSAMRSAAGLVALVVHSEGMMPTCSKPQSGGGAWLSDFFRLRRSGGPLHGSSVSRVPRSLP